MCCCYNLHLIEDRITRRWHSGNTLASDASGSGSTPGQGTLLHLIEDQIIHSYNVCPLVMLFVDLIKQTLHERSWSLICCQGSPLNRANLRASCINLCDMSIVLSARNSNVEDGNLVDKEAILCSLNIKAMTFDEIVQSVSRSALGCFAAHNTIQVMRIQWCITI